MTVTVAVLTAAAEPAIIPQPEKIETLDERFQLKAACRICVEQQLKDEAQMLSDRLQIP